MLKLPSTYLTIIPTLTMMIIPSSDTARHSATSGSLDLSIHTTEVQVVFLTHWCRVLSGDWKPYNTCLMLWQITYNISYIVQQDQFHSFSFVFLSFTRCSQSSRRRLVLGGTGVEHLHHQTRSVRNLSCKDCTLYLNTFINNQGWWKRFNANQRNNNAMI